MGLFERTIAAIRCDHEGGVDGDICCACGFRVEYQQLYGGHESYRLAKDQTDILAATSIAMAQAADDLEGSKCEFCGEHRAGIRTATGPWLYGPCHMCSAKRERRERIATAALQGIITANVSVPCSAEESLKAYARASVLYADALIAALDSKDTP